MLKPLGDRVIIEVAKEEEKTVGGIVLASAAKEKPQTGTVKAGDQVMFEKYAGTEVKYEGKEYLIVAGKDIMAIVE